MKQRILVVDDEPQIRDILRKKLEQSGYHVSEAVNGQEAIDMLEESQFDLVLADILMPEKDGLEVIMYIQREQPLVKCVAVSAPSNRVFLQSAELLGATKIIEKPFELKEVDAIVKNLLS
jgi:CheY-like chemotaxis protein